MRRGFSLAEMLVLLALLTVMAGLALTASPGAKERGGTRAAAELLASELRAARQRALAEQIPVAVCLPSANGSVPHTQSLYVMEGESLPRIVRTIERADETADTYLVAGTWPGPAWSRAPVAAMSGASFSLSGNWALPFPADPVLVFTPGGAVVSNLPHGDGTYRLLACAGLTYATASVAGGPSFQVDNLHHPVTVLVGQNGLVRVVSGVEGGTGLTLLQGRSTPAAAPAPPPPFPSGANVDPQVSGSVVVLPQPLPGTLPAGVDATVQLGRFLSLQVEARDPDGDPLFCQWRCQESPGGAFSTSAVTRMSWDQTANAWVSLWEWAPPPGATAGQQYHLSCLVTDLKGGAVTAIVGSTGTVETLEKELLLVSSSSRGPGVYDLYTMNTDGTAPRRLAEAPGTEDRYPVLSPDGTKVAFSRNGEVWLMNRDGSGQVRVARPPRYSSIIRWHPLGTKIFFEDALTNSSTDWDLYLVNPDGSHPETLAPNSYKKLNGAPFTIALTQGSGFDVHPNGDRLLVVDSLSNELKEIGYDTATRALTWQASIRSGLTRCPSYSPDGNWIACSDTTLLVAPYTYVAGGPGTVGAFNNLPYDADQPRWAPDSLRLCFIHDLTPGVWTADYATATIERTGTNLRVLTPNVAAGLEWVDPQWLRR
ncbi:MAG: hypothetical protein AMXMBFR33_61810 [Candidatus Xenobia bacterium]